jgi:hypothetical protein
MFKFKAPGQEDKANQDTTEIQAVAAAANKCLGMSEFRSYAERYQALERSIVEELIKDARTFSADQTTLEKFSAKALLKLTRIYDLRTLLMSVTTDAKRDKGAPDGKERGELKR